MLKKINVWVLLALFTFVMASCKKDDTVPEDEQELITTVRLTLTSVSNSTEVVTATWKDTDGPGGTPPVISGLNLRQNAIYTGRIAFLDESRPNDPKDITEEVEEEEEDHEVFYTVTGANLVVSSRNLDAKGLPLGTRANFATGAASAGTLKIILKHKPGTKAAGDQSTKGETDVEADLPIQIQ
jgi:hypothetical protein